MMKTGVRRIVKSGDAPTVIGPYSQAVMMNGFAFTSGQIPIDKDSGRIVDGGILEQTEKALDNLSAILTQSGTSLKNAVIVNIYLKSLSDFGIVNECYARRVDTDNPPARVTVEVSGLPKDALIEISAIAPTLPFAGNKK